MIAAEVRPTRHAHRGDHARAAVAQLDDRHQREATGRVAAARARPLGRRLALRRPRRRFLGSIWRLKRSRGHLVHAEGREQLAQEVVGRQVAVLELLAVRAISASTNCRTASRTISCSSDHSNMPAE